MGLITIGLAVITTNLDSQFQFQLSNVTGVLAGPILAVFLLGFFTTTANKYGAITGMLCGNAFTIWLLMGSLVKTLPKSPSNKLPIYTEGCGKPNSSLYLNVYDVVNNHSQRKETFFYIPEGDDVIGKIFCIVPHIIYMP
jgi:sodium-coupled monocarboxylate transporter 8/12